MSCFFGTKIPKYKNTKYKNTKYKNTKYKNTKYKNTKYTGATKHCGPLTVWQAAGGSRQGSRAFYKVLSANHEIRHGLYGTAGTKHKA